MQPKTLFTAALVAGAASAQEMMNLTAALGGQEDLSSLVGLLQTYPDVAASIANRTNVTLLAPNNDAISTLLESAGTNATSAPEEVVAALLNYHVLQGQYTSDNISSTPSFVPTYLNDTGYSNVTGGQVVEIVAEDDNVVIYSGLRNNATVTQADLNFTGGIIHIIDSVLTIPLNASTTALAAGLTDFLGAVIMADLGDTVDGLMDATIFAPTNNAFEAIGSLLGNLTTEQLTSILTYHIVNGTVAYSTLLTNTTVPTLEGNEVTITVANGSVFVNQARVIVADILVAEGVCHVIDSVLNPNNTMAMPSNGTEPAVGYSGAMTSTVPLSTNLPVTAYTLPVNPALTSTDSAVVSGQTQPSGSEIANNPANTADMTSSTGGAALPMKTGAVGAAALFGAGAFLANL